MKRYLQCAEQQVSLSKLTKYCACHEKRISWLILVTHETLFTMRGTTGGILQHHQILRLPRKMILQKFQQNFSKTSFTMRDRSETIPRMIRAGSEHETVTPQPASQPRLLFTPTTSILYWKIQHFALRLSFQISPNTAPAAKNDTWTSPNTAPATQNEFHDWSAWHMKRYLQCAEQQVASSNITKYCACHAKWLSWSIRDTPETLFTMRGTTGGILQHHQILRLPRQMILQNFRNISPKQMKRQLQCATDPRPFRAGSENETVIRNPPRNRGYFSRPPQAFCIEKYNASRSGYHSKFHRILRLPRKVTLQLHRIRRLPRKVTLQLHRILRLPRKVTLERHQIMRLPRKVTLERHRIMHLPRKVTLERHQIVHLPRKVTLERHQIVTRI